MSGPITYEDLVALAARAAGHEQYREAIVLSCLGGLMADGEDSAPMLHILSSVCADIARASAKRIAADIARNEIRKIAESN
jgi:hypothetical protein